MSAPDDWLARNGRVSHSFDPDLVNSVEMEGTHLSTVVQSGAVTIIMRARDSEGGVREMRLELTPSEARTHGAFCFADAHMADALSERQDAGRWDNRRKA